MKRVAIGGSSRIRSVGYDSNNKTLEVEFIPGRIYKYWPITEEVYKGLLASTSKGRFFEKAIKNAPGITYTRVDEIQT